MPELDITKEMPDPSPQLKIPKQGSRVAIGAADCFPIVLVEATGALGVLAAQRRCPDETLEKVLYFRLLMGQPYARFFDAVELLSIDGFFVARVLPEQALFFEPSTIPYAIKNLSKAQYEQFVDDVVTYRCDRVEELISTIFSVSPGFSLGANGKLRPPARYASGMDHFLAEHTFVEPNEPSK